LSTLLEAVKNLRIAGLNVELDVYGAGTMSTPKASGINYRGRIPFGDAQKVIRAYDLLVLPSLHDGWGVVVNEALMQGVPVVVSTACGARTLVEVSGAGRVFEAGSSDDLMEALSQFFGKYRLVDCQRKARDFAPSLEPIFAATYLYHSLLHVSDPQIPVPKPPWYP
jgi:glycosyltransferase involved in cell wall biosynthesis